MSLLRNLNPYELHKHLVNEYMLTNKGSTKLLTRDTSKDKRDFDVIKENHKFLWDDDPADTWEKQLAKKYYDKLFKEYCICDLSKYKENKVALRWRIEQEVVIGKGQFTCGNKKCTEKENLKSWEVNFAYLENGEKKNALVKLRLCGECSTKLNYHTKKREVKRLKRGDKRRSSKGKERAENKKDGDMNIEENLPHDDEASASSSETNKNKTAEIEQEPWRKGNAPEEKSRDEEFEEYLEDLLL